jgi:hypothetical protein
MGKWGAALLLACLVACDDRAGGLPLGSATATALDPSAVVTDLDATCAGVGGLTARAAIDGLAASYPATLQTSRESVGATIGFTYSMGQVRCTQSIAHACVCDRQGCDTDCGADPAHIEVDMDVTFKTADGTFNEHFTAPVVFDGRDRWWQATVPGSEVKGTYAFVGALKQIEDVSFDGLLSGDTMTGEVTEINPQGVTVTTGRY